MGIEPLMDLFMLLNISVPRYRFCGIAKKIYGVHLGAQYLSVSPVEGTERG